MLEILDDSNRANGEIIKKYVQQGFETFNTINAHTIKLNELDCALNLTKSKFQAMNKEVTSIYRDMGLLENSK